MKQLMIIKQVTLKMIAILLSSALLLANTTFAEQPTAQNLPELSIYNVTGEWNTGDGQKMALTDLADNVVIMAMGYATCKGVCPRIVADMRRIEQGLTAEEQAKTKFVFVSIDPDVDTPPMLAHFAHMHELNPDNWVLLQSDKALTRELAAVLSVSYKKTDDKDYAHSSIISVLDRQGVLVAQQEGLVTKSSIIHDALQKLL